MRSFVHSRLRAARSDERGFTLVEVLMALAITGIAVTALLAGLGVAVQASDMHRKQATSETYLRQGVENVKAAAYAPCQPSGSSVADPYDGAVSSVWVSSGYTPVRISSVQVWKDGSWQNVWTSTSDWVGSCGTTSFPDPALQRITVTAGSLDDRATESVEIVKRNALS